MGLPLTQRLGYSVGHVLNDLTASVWFSYLIVYFHQVMNFNNNLAGYLMLIGQVSDALFTPFIGYESDNTRGFCRLGKRKSWHLVGTICVACSYPFVFNDCITCSNAPDWSKFIYFAPFVVIFQFGWASTQISHLSLIPDLTQDENERVELNGIRYAFTVLSNLAVFGIFWLLFIVHGDKSDSTETQLTSVDSLKFRNLVFIIVGMGLVFSIAFHFIVREPVQHEDLSAAENAYADGYSTSIEKSTALRSRMTWSCWLKTMQFYQIALVYMCTRLFVNVSQIYLPLYVTETLLLPKDTVAICPLVVYVSGFIASVAMRPINSILGRKATYAVGLFFGVGACVWIYFLSEDTAKQVYGAVVLLGLGGSTMLVTSLAMTSDLIANNVESGAFVYGAMSFTDKLSNGVAVVLIQHLHPCVACCPSCKGYYRLVLTFVPGGVAALALLALLTLLPSKIGVRSNNENALKKPVHGLKEDNSVNEEERRPLLGNHITQNTFRHNE
ncbi:major facilitator superfamily domain-containing protein 12-like isoform X1 [Saccostrea echinata]|uniref:major facilitator superfamily domain-containing protein 12-like isoform X1 n=1 Tax=Saccostrea echinata TaxID=191078 RepID=UPI002A82F7BC|nr:major facilitator superfamily domain-containing protein 12-like isoform X1 [Saccostrea echinata]